MDLPEASRGPATRVGDLTPWERAQLGRALRREGWTYGEIRRLIPVAKATVAGWCRGIDLGPDQIAAIRARTAGRAGVPKDTQWRRRQQIEEIRRRAHAEVADLFADPLWVAGTALYWAEGVKAVKRLQMSNSDPAILQLFVAWARRFHLLDEHVLALHLHAGNDEQAAQAWWATALPEASGFTKTFVKPEGTGHRKNHLAHGLCRVTFRRSTDGWYRTEAWIGTLAKTLTGQAILDSGR
jgi:hypothetical protein